MTWFPFLLSLSHLLHLISISSTLPIFHLSLLPPFIQSYQGLWNPQLAHNVLRTICFLELGESMFVLWLFCIEPSHNILGMVQDTQLAHNVLRTIFFLRSEFQYFSIMLPTDFPIVQFKVMSLFIQRYSVGISGLQHNASYRFPHSSI